MMHWLGVAPARAEPTASAEPSSYGAVATATRLARPSTRAAASVTVLGRRELEASPSATTDGVLRSLPSVATFRRSSSLSADPSSQGLNLRGVAPSGVARTLVLLDGVPINDPFAGAIYFRALPRLGLERIEVVPGGGSALYGSAALAGVVQLLSRTPTTTTADADLSYGNAHTLQAAARVAAQGTRTQAAVESDLLASDGFPVVTRAQRGPVDGPASSRSGNVLAHAAIALPRRTTLSPSLHLFREDLSGQTRTTSATVQLGIAALRVRHRGRRGSVLDALVFARAASFEQSRARVDEQRSAETRAARQFVPAGDQGLSITWASAAPEGRGQQWLLGMDARAVLGHADERLFSAQASPDTPVRRDAGGRQAFGGMFVQDLVRLTDALALEGVLRLDAYGSYRGHALSEYATGASRRSFAPSRAFTVNPRLGLLAEPWAFLRLRASAYRAFRAPTLNELYRPFQVGTVLTAPNPRLAPELLTGAEASGELLLAPLATFRATGFSNLLDQPISNVTLPAPLDGGATRQRFNVGAARVRGFELSLDVRLRRRWYALLGYTFVDARVTREGQSHGLRGKRLAQDPVHRASALVSYEAPQGLSLSLQARLVGSQFEDDRNTLPMGAYALLDAFASFPLTGPLTVFAAVENLLDREYLVGRAGIDTIGTPLLARVGLRVRASAAR